MTEKLQRFWRICHILAAKYAVERVTLRSGWQRRGDRVLLSPVQLLRFVIKSISTDLPHLYLEYVQVVWSCPCPCEVNASLPRILRRLCVPITWLPPFLVISPSSFVKQVNGTLHRQCFFRFGEFWITSKELSSNISVLVSNALAILCLYVF